MFGKTLFLAAAFAAVTLAAECPGSELLKLTPIASNTNVATCTADSGFNLIPPSGLPSDEQKTKMCKSDACKALITAIKAQDPSDCDLNILGVTLNVGSLVGTFDADCTRLLGSSTPAATTATPSTPDATTATPSTTTTTTTAPSTTTAAPDATKAQC